MIIAKIVYLFLMIGAVFFCILYSGSLSVWLLVVVVLLPIIMKIVTLITRQYISINLEPLKLSENKNTPIQFKVALKNKSIFPVSTSVINIEYFNSLDNKKEYMSINIPIQPRNSQTVTFTLSSKYCGKLEVYLKNLVIYDFFKLSKTVISSKLIKETVILPQSYDLDLYVNSNSDIALDSEIFSKIKSGDDSSEVFNFKDYQQGDKTNRINWKLSTKQDKLLIKEYSLPIKTNILIIFEFFRNSKDPLYMPRLDTLIDLITAISEKLAENETFHCIRWFNSSLDNLMTETISDSEDVAIFLGKLLQSNPYSNSLNALEQHNTLYPNEHYSHIIYVTSEANQTVINSFSNNEQSEMKTILYVTDDTLKKADNSQFGFNLIPVHIGNIMSSIQELII